VAVISGYLGTFFEIEEFIFDATASMLFS